MMIFYKYFLKIISLILLFSIISCSTSKKRIVELTQNINNDSIYSYYCKNGKQSHAIKISGTYIHPKNQSGKVLDLQAKNLKRYDKFKNDILSKAFYSLSSTSQNVAVTTSSSYEEVVTYAKNMQHSFISSADVSINPLIVATPDSNKFIFFHERVDGACNSIMCSEFSKEESISIRELKYLVDNYVLLEPFDYQLKSYTCEKDCPFYDVDTGNGFSGYSHPKRPIGQDENKNVNISEYVKLKNLAWMRYFMKNTQINEAQSTDSQIYNLELSLNLDGFCTYGRNINDLHSQ